VKDLLPSTSAQHIYRNLDPILLQIQINLQFLLDSLSVHDQTFPLKSAYFEGLAGPTSQKALGRT
jgi:hypothetical protein